MLTKVKVFSIYGPFIELPFTSDIFTNPFQIRSISGLGPVKSNITTTPFGSQQGELFVGSSVGKRNIVMSIGLNPNWDDQSMESLRASLYTYFMTDQQVVLQLFSTHLPTVQILGVVESLEPNIFSKDPEVQVSIICPQPDFVDINPTTVNGLVVAANTDTDINYIGTVPAAFLLSINPTVGVPSYTGGFTIKNKLDIVGSLQSSQFGPATVDATHNVQFSSLPGNKYITNNGMSNPNLLSVTTDSSDWPFLLFGDNKFYVKADVAGQAWVMTYYNRFGGM